MVILQESPPIYPLSDRSTAAVPNSIFHATDFILGAGVVIMQPSTAKIVLVTDNRERWFLPKGRKDKGESLEQTALREAYEEVRLMNSPIPLPIPSFRPPFDVKTGCIRACHTLAPYPSYHDHIFMRVLSLFMEGSVRILLLTRVPFYLGRF